MDIIITLPDPKFKIGDIVKITQRHDLEGFLVIGQVDIIYGDGTWKFQKGKAFVDEKNLDYLLTIQEGSKDCRGGLIRPGSSIAYSVEELDAYGELIESKV